MQYQHLRTLQYDRGRPTVLLAQHGASPVVLKSATPHRERKDFCFEGAILQEVHHPNLVRLLDCYEGAVGNFPPDRYLVLEHLAGAGYVDIVSASAQSPRDAARVISAVGEALQAIHAAGYAHNDVNPRNIRLCGDTVKLFDLSIAAPLGSCSLQQWGTPGFESPQQWQKHNLEGNDVFGLGMTLYAALKGYVPKIAITQRIMRECVKEAGLGKVAIAMVDACAERRPSLDDLPALIASALREQESSMPVLYAR